VDQATLPDPDQPVRPILWLYTLIAMVVGLLIGTAWAFIADSYDHTVRTIDQAERFLGKPVIVSIPSVHGGIIR
jgi:capsular polysaccharide biosynthesis protein